MAAVPRDLFIRKHGKRRPPCLLSAGILASSCFQWHRSTCDRRHDQNCIAVVYRRIDAAALTNVFIVHVDIHEIAERVLIVKKMSPQFSMRRGQFLKRFARSCGINMNFSLAGCKLSQRGWY